MTGLLITAVGFPLVGAAVRRLSGRGPRFLLGVGTVGCVLYLALLLHIPPVPVLVLIIAAAILTLVFVPRRIEDVAVRRNAAATVVTAAPLLMLLFTTAIIPLADYDGRAFWVLKAKAIATEGRIDGSFFSGERGHHPKNEYPLLVPLSAAAVMIAARDLDDSHIRWIYVLALGSFAFHARRWVGPWPAALIAWIPQLAVESAQSAYNDIFVAAFAALAFFEVIEGRSPLRFGLWISFLVLAKNEGLPYSLLLLALAAATWRGAVIRALPPYAVALITLFVWRSRVEPTDDDPLIQLLPTLPEKLERFVPAVTQFWSHAFDFDRWGVFWWAFFAALVMAVGQTILSVRRREEQPGQTGLSVLQPLFLIGGMSGIYIAAYMVTTWQLADHVNASADRLLMHFLGPALYLISGFGRDRYSLDRHPPKEVSTELDRPHPDRYHP